MVDNKKRIGRATSSQIHRIIDAYRGPGKFIGKAQTYFEELQLEREMGRSVNVQTSSQEMNWGKFGEIRVFEMMGLEYSMTHKQTEEHPDFPGYWSGTADLVADDRRGEIKCYYPKKFGKLVKAMKTGDPEEVKKADPATYWQVISNCLIAKVPIAEIVVYMPYESEANEIKELVTDPEWLTRHGFQPWELRFIAEATDPESASYDLTKLPFLPNDSKFDNLNTFEFEIPMEDRLLMTKAMTEAVQIFGK